MSDIKFTRGINLIDQALLDILREYMQAKAIDPEVWEQCDISDLGNIVGAAIWKHMKSKEEQESFQAGLSHGISIADGSHG